MKRAEITCVYRKTLSGEMDTLPVRGYECEIQGIRFVVHRLDQVLAGYDSPGWGVSDPVTGRAVLRHTERTRALALDEAATRIKEVGGLPAVEKAQKKHGPASDYIGRQSA